MNDTPVLVTRNDAVATVAMNRPERRNALTDDLKAALLDAVREVAKDTDVRAVVLAGTGSAFSVGQDLAEHAARLEDGAATAFATVRDHYSPLVMELLSLRKPVVAAVSGACVGAGLGLALACDLRVFGVDAKLATAFTGIGLTFDSGLSYTLPRAVGDAKARELMLLGRSFDAREAVQWGIAGQVVAPEDVLSTARHLASRLAKGPTVAYAETKRLLLAGFPGAVQTALGAEADAQTRCGATDDHRAAVSAFLAREKPQFAGR